MKNSKSEYFYFEPYVHINLKEQQALLYNTFTNDYKLINEAQIIEQIRNNIQNNQNGFIINSKIEKEKCKELRDAFFGDIIELKSKDEFPFLIPTEFFKIEKNLNYLRDKQIRNLDDGIKRSFKELDLYLDNPYREKSIRNQIPFIFDESSKKHPAFTNFINQMENNENFYGLNRINIYIKNCTEENIGLIKKIENKLRNLILNVHFESNNLESLIDADNNVDKIVYYSFNEDTLTNCEELSTSIKESLKIIFVIQNEEQFLLSEELIVQYNLKNFSYKPYYNRNNLEFFKDFIFLDEESIFSVKKSKEEIFLNKEINEIDFGKVIIFNDGYYSTSCFKPVIGNIENVDINQILNNCYFSEDSSWFLTRNKVSVCKNCVYNQLCPPISIYEHALGRYNLCDIL